MEIWYEKRYCGLCNNELEYIHYRQSNMSLTAEQLYKYWNNEGIVILCCNCILKIRTLFNEMHLEDFTDGKIRIKVNRDSRKYSGINYQSIVVDKIQLDNILEMVFD